MLVRILFALLALLALYGLVSPQEKIDPEFGDLPRVLVLASLLVLCLGMVVPWGRWFRLDSPRGNLAFVSKLLGWAGASGVPLTVVSREVVAGLICVLMPLLAFALWNKRAWAAWAWYAVALACLAPTVAGLSAIAFSLLFQVHTTPPTSDVVLFGVLIAWTLFWGSVTVTLMRELTVWRRNLRLPMSTACSAPAT